MDTSIKTQQDLTSVRKLECTGCGSSLSVQNPRAKTIACSHCGSVLDLNSEAYQILEKIGNPERFPPMSFIRLGMKAVFDNKTYQVIARTRYLQKYQEYWREEGESGYSTEVWRFDEWLLIDENRTYFYLIEDQEGYWISDEFIPEKPMMPPKSLRMSFFNGHRDQIIKEHGRASVIYFEGESNYRVKAGDEVRFAMYNHSGINYSVEWRMKGPSEIGEIEFFEETPISRRKLLEAFRDNPELDELRKREASWRFVNRVARIAALVFGIFSLWSCTYDGSSIFEQSVDYTQILQADGFISDPVDIPDDDVYRLSMRSQGLSENSEIYVFAYILDSAQQVVNTMDKEMYYYAGYDSDGRWTETEYEVKQRFKLKKGERYYLQLFADTDNPGMITGEIQLRVAQGVMMTRYFFISLILSLVVMMYARGKSGR